MKPISRAGIYFSSIPDTFQQSSQHLVHKHSGAKPTSSHRHVPSARYEYTTSGELRTARGLPSIAEVVTSAAFPRWSPFRTFRQIENTWYVASSFSWLFLCYVYEYCTSCMHASSESSEKESKELRHWYTKE